MQYHRVPIDKLDSMPCDVVQVCDNYYWALDEDENILFKPNGQFKYCSPQCSNNPNIVRLLLRFHNHPGVSIRKISRVLVPWDTAEYY